MSGRLQGYDEVTEKNHERMNEFEDELISLRRMMERIGKEKRACIADPIAPWIIIVAVEMGILVAAFICFMVRQS
jgi:hypothetical protein